MANPKQRPKTAAATDFPPLPAPAAPADKSHVDYRTHSPSEPGHDQFATGVANRYNDALGYKFNDGHGGTGTIDRYNQYRTHGQQDAAQDLLLGQMSGEFMKDRDAPGYRPDRIQAAQADYNNPGDAERYNVSDPGAADAYKAALMDKPQDVHVGQLTPTKDVQSSGVGGPGPAAITGMERVQGAQLDTSHADRVQGQQDNYLHSLQNRAAGNAPSVAENAYSSKMADIAANAQGIAGQARGSDKAYARLHAMDTIADQGRKAAFESAQLRAGEMDAASNQLGSQLGNVRGQDVDVAKTAAQLHQEAALSNQRTTLGTEQFNAGAVNQQNQFSTGVQERNAERAQAASAANAGAANARTMDEAQLNANVNTGNVTRDMGANQFNATAQNAASVDNTAAANARAVYRAGQQTTANATNTAAANARADFRSTGMNQTDQFNAGQVQGADVANQNAGVQGAQLDVTRKQGLAQDALNTTGQQTNIVTTRMGVPKPPSTQDRLLGAGTTLAASGIAASDERVKKNIRDVPDDAASRLASALQLKEFEYKGERDDGQTHMGVMAQDLEKDPLGRKLVHENDEGVKHVDYGGLTQLLLAAALRGKKEARR